MPHSSRTIVVPRPKQVQEAERTMRLFLELLSNTARGSSAERQDFARRHHRGLIDIYILLEPFASARDLDVKLDLLQRQGVF